MESKRYCPKGHDTWSCGRAKNNRCRECARQQDKEFRRTAAYRDAQAKRYAQARRERRENGQFCLPIPNLRRVREELGLSIRQLAKIAEVNPTTLSRIERGSTARYYTAVRIKHAVKVVQAQRAAAARRRGKLVA